jgi:hypothetical protein
MEAMKTALLLDSKETISRANDPLGALVGRSATDIMAAASKHTDRDFDRKYFDSVSITREENKIVLNLKIPANAGEAGSVLRKRASESDIFFYSNPDTIKLTIK